MVKTKKGGKGKGDAPPEAPSEFDAMAAEDLETAIGALSEELRKVQMERNYVQVERDSLQTFYELTKREVGEHELDIESREKDMDELDDNHRVEVRVFQQKLKHLQYEHKNNLRRSSSEGKTAEIEEKKAHEKRVEKLNEEKRVLQTEITEVERKNEDDVEQIQETQKKNLSKLEETFDENLETLREKYEDSLEDLRMELELRRKVEMHEVEERKNSHINDLIKNHEKAFEQIKTYYNDITRDNLNLIKTLKDEIASMKSNTTANQKIMYDIAQENKKLSQPLTVAIREVEELRYKLKDFGKDKTSLKHTSSRLKALKAELSKIKARNKDLETDFKNTEFERDEIYDTFEDTIHDVQRRAELKNVVLEQKLQTMSGNQEEQINGIKALCHDIEPSVVSKITREIDHAMAEKNLRLRDLEHFLAMVQKTHNDSVRTLTEKLCQMGIPDEDAVLSKLMPTDTSTMPARMLN